MPSWRWRRPKRPDPALRPQCQVAGDPNVFELVALVRTTLRAHGQEEAARELTDRLMQAESYDEALAIIAEYVLVGAG